MLLLIIVLLSTASSTDQTICIRRGRGSEEGRVLEIRKSIRLAIVRKSRGNGLFWYEIDDGRVNGGRVSGRHLLLSVIRFRECQYSVMRNPARQSSATGPGLAGNTSRHPVASCPFCIHYSRGSQLANRSGLHFSTSENPISFGDIRCRAAYNKIAYCIRGGYSRPSKTRTIPYLWILSSILRANFFFFFFVKMSKKRKITICHQFFKIDIFKDLFFLSFNRIKFLPNSQIENLLKKYRTFKIKWKMLSVFVFL